MTVIWSIEIFSWIFEDSIFLYIMSIINCLQGFIIFFIFACRDEQQTLVQQTRNNVEMLEDEVNARLYAPIPQDKQFE
jgi:hypothetical protein